MAGKANIGAKITLDGEKEYRQAIGNVSKSMGVLKSDLKAVTSEFQNNANSIDALKAKNEILTKQQTEQEKKLQLLRGVLESVTKEYGENSKKAQDWQIKLNNAYAELNQINSELSDNKKYMKEAETSTDKTAKSIDQFGKQVKQTKDETLTFGDVLKANLSSQAIISGIKAMGNALESVTKSAIDVVKSTAEYADNIMVMSSQTGIATDTLQELNYMAELTDTSLETITSSMAKNIRSMASAQSGTDKYVEAYSKLGIQITNTNGQLADSEQVFWNSIDALGKMANETERDALAMQLFGKSAQDLNPLIELGKDRVAEFAREAQNMGAVLSDDTLVSLGETDDALQRMYQQIEITKREFGQEFAPAMTEAFAKVTNKLGEVDGKFADFAGGALNGVVDGFIWMIDNADKLEAGLKGIGAAIIAKKAADGVIAAVNAYKILTTTTEAATAAQTAFNVASKANVIGAIASVVIGLGTALYSYAKSAQNAAEETRKLNDETEQLIEKSERVTETVRDNIEDRKKSLNAISSETNATKTLIDSLYDLYEEQDKTNISKEQMLALVEQINKAIPDLNLSLDEQTGLLSKQRGEVEKLAEAQLELNTVQALQGELSKIALDKYNQEKALNDLLDAQKQKRKEIEALEEEYNNAAKNSAKYGWDWNFDSAQLDSKLNKANKAFEENEKKIKAAEAAVKELGVSYEEALQYIGNHSVADSVSTAFDKFLSKYKSSIDEQNEAYADSFEERTDAINESYKASEKALEKAQKAEKKALDKAHDEQLKAVEEAADKELGILEKQYNKKLKLIDKEYVAKMKLVDEDRYKALKVVQDQIDAIDNQSEAEDKARKLKEEAEKRSELQLQVANAETIDDKMKAQKELADFEDDVARDRKKTERQLQKDILEDQKGTINDAYDAKIKKLEDAEEAEKKSAEKIYKKEQETIKNRYDKKKEELKEIQDLEDEALADRQEAAQDGIDKQKKYALKKAKETYDEDLANFKLNNALKYDEAVKNQDKINKYAMEQNKLTTGGLKTSIETLKNSGVWDTNFKSWGGLKSTTSSAAMSQTDYNNIAKMVEDGFSKSIKKATFSLTLNGKAFGKAVGSEVQNMLR